MIGGALCGVVTGVSLAVLLRTQKSHSLTKGAEQGAVRKAVSGLQCNARTRAAIRMINPYYAGKDLQYTEVGFKRYPDVSVLLGLAVALDRLSSLDNERVPSRTYFPQYAVF